MRVYEANGYTADFQDGKAVIINPAGKVQRCER